jgi:DNA-binding MarR family transcriptional regulator
MTAKSPRRKAALATTSASASIAASSSNSASARPGDPEFYRGDDYHVEDSIGYLLKLVRNAMMKAIDEEMTEHDLTGVQWGPLLMIDQKVGTTAAELARIGCVDTGAMTRMLDRLETKGLLRRTPCPKDRRMVQLELTDEGQAMCRKIPYGLSRVHNSMLRGFTAAELDTFKSFARRMLANAERE